MFQTQLVERLRELRLVRALVPQRPRYRYDRAFAPYVMPETISLREDDFPDLRWFGLMLRSQARAAAGSMAIRARQRAPAWLGVRDRLEAVSDAVFAHAPGRIPSGGDAEFAYLRFAGNNPFAVRRARRMDEIPERLRLSDPMMERLLGPGTTLSGRLQRGTLFLATYESLRPGAGALQEGRFVAPVKVLFCEAPEMAASFPVVPLAIECSSGGGAPAVCTPLDGERWIAARKIASAADINESELCVHLARAHYMTVPFAMALRAVFPKHHKLYQFLLPHLRFNMFVDRMAWVQGLRESSGVLVSSLAGTPEWCQSVARSVHQTHSFRQQHFERDLIARGVDEHPVEYPYRDDGRLLWSAIKELVDAFVRQTWPDDGAILEDEALQRFMAELSHPEGGNIKELIEGPRLETREELVEILTQVLFVAGPLHALAHYASAAQLQHVNDNPSWLTANPLAGGKPAEPGEVGALAQYHRVVSTNCRYDQFGDFSRYPLGAREDCREMISRFQERLQSIEEIITERNAHRPAPFIHFLPSRISNGITV
jgi:arachidonate 15-lipoxygenase